MKIYKLLDADGKVYASEIPGTLGGNSKLKVYGRLDCGTALSAIRQLLNRALDCMEQLQEASQKYPPPQQSPDEPWW